MRASIIKTLFLTYKSIGIISLSSITSAIITFLVLPLVTRLYSLEEFAEYGLAISIISMCSVVTMLRLDQALLLIKVREEQYKILFESIFFASIIIFLLGWIFLLKFTQTFVLGLISGIAANNIIQLIYNMNFSLGNDYICASINILRALTWAIMQLLFPVFFSLGLMEVYIFNSLFLIVMSISYLVIFKCIKVSFFSFINYRDIILYNMPHALLNSFSHNLPYYMISAFLSTQFLGMYMMVERVLKIPISLFSQIFRQFYIRKFSQENQKGEGKLALVHSILISLISFPFFVIFIIMPNSVYVFILGDKWNGVAEIFAILALGYWAIFCNPPASAYLIAKRNSKILLHLQIVELFLKVILFSTLYYFFKNSVWVLLAIPISLCFYNLMILFKVREDVIEKGI